MGRFSVFFENIQKDLKTYLFLIVLLCVYRGAFIFIMQEYIGPNTAMNQIALAMWAGLRLTLKSAGIMAMLSFLACTLTTVMLPRFNTNRLRVVLGYVYIVVLSILFQARIPYYRVFNVTFNQNIYNTFNDDVYALFITMIQEYNLPSRILAAILIGAIICYLFKLVLFSRNYRLPQFTATKSLLLRCSIIASIPVFMLFMRFGGSFTYNHSINWENAAITKDTFLNEAVLDDIQALYRAYSVNERMSQGAMASGVHKEKIREYAKMAAGNDIESDRIDDYLIRHAAGAKIAKPRHIFIILGETYAQWPIMEKYSKLNLANGLKEIIQQDNAIYTSSFLPNGSFTQMAISAMVSGLSDVSVPVNYQPRSYEKPYATALAPQMQKLGYKVDFWYGGFPSWERIKDFTLAQGFDHFYSSTDFAAEQDNIWGTKDEYIFQALLSHLSEEEPTVHLILTVSNHPPYNLDLEKAGFDPSKIIDGLPEEQKNNQELIRQLGHYWYMDKVVHDFVRETEQKYPDSLFIITGDHADRVNVTKTPVPFERYSIPLVIYGQGITKDILPPNRAGGHVNIMPTLIELLAPENFTYYSIGNSLTKENKVGFNPAYWITPHAMGSIEHPDEYEILSATDDQEIRHEKEMAEEKVSMMRTISSWILLKGNQL
ncbi:alkaline phosphatase family protein [Pelosinus sp. IPA-1]|uniref:LTA synthase family protein n=1 Tax=Pelosinus sp. IPA-1 TaxID=3029569 RepID=UPI0024362685|nr:alkaline phosphatase family protein [Pelosinus sp. IPA-1]GMB01275.1 phosphatidylglycerol--membrane-oligosaccharide glycerophosphotransferase [Pelosinus sp. IPA-1]